MNKQIQQSYTGLGTQETRVVNRMISTLATQNLNADELKSLTRYVGRYRTSDKKRKKSGYILFYQEMYPALRKQHPGNTLGQIAKLVGKQWKDKSKSEQDIYNKKAAQI